MANLFDRANHYRQQKEFDKAQATYENILQEDINNAEAHWGVVLSKFGIEYVEDPKTHKLVPTCHRVQSLSVLNDLDYLKAIGNASDGYTRSLYEQEAKAVSDIQRSILAISGREEPYDVFICYKETDETGRRTVDSTLAQDIYFQLKNENLKVFFSRITLEDKLGNEYEPYIFAALNSAKVMLVVGTKPEYFNAVWVRNEWLRYVTLFKNSKDKIIIPCYRDMNAYDLPEELSVYQAQDMSKIGFIQDVVRGIKKVTASNIPVQSTGGAQAVYNAMPDYNANAQQMVKRAFLFLEDSDWVRADQLLEQSLNINFENAKAYIGKLMIETKTKKEDDLANIEYDYSNNSNFSKALKFADESYLTVLMEYKRLALERLKRSEAQKLEKSNQGLIWNYNFLNNEMCKLIRKRNIFRTLFIVSAVLTMLTVVVSIILAQNTLYTNFSYYDYTYYEYQEVMNILSSIRPILIIADIVFLIIWRTNAGQIKRKNFVVEMTKSEMQKKGLL